MSVSVWDEIRSCEREQEEVKIEVRIERVRNTSYNRAQFRRLAHDTVGDAYEPTNGYRVYFAYYVYIISNTNKKEKIVGGGCCCPADKRLPLPPSGQINDSYSHHIGLLFVEKNYREMGIGSAILKKMEDEMMMLVFRPIQLYGSDKAYEFYRKLHYDCYTAANISNDPNLCTTFRVTYFMVKSPFVYFYDKFKMKIFNMDEGLQEEFAERRRKLQLARGGGSYSV